MTTGKFTLVIRWPSGQSTICGEMTDHQHGEICRILSPDYRAQLPSQGGEAVATGAFVPGSLADLLFQLGEKGIGVSGGTHGDHWRVSPLYTHPADQVADDLTMVKVSRELLEKLLRDANYNEKYHGITVDSTEELRALLANSEGVKP